MKNFIAGDIGGTKTSLRMSAGEGARSVLLQKSYSSANYAGLAEILDELMQEAGVFNLKTSVSQLLTAAQRLPRAAVFAELVI